MINDQAVGFIQGNTIFENIMANIVIGGHGEEESTILKNKIYDGRCEGIFLLENVKTRIFLNEILNNYTGISCINSSPIIFMNQICLNKTYGIMIMKKSNV